MAISFNDQFFVERDRGLKFQYLSLSISLLLPIIHGILFHWVPWILRQHRDRAGLKNQRYFIFVKIFDTMNRVYGVKLYKWKFYVQPSFLLVMAFHLSINSVFATVETIDLDYLPRFYIVGKRIGRLAVGNLPPLLIFVTHNNLVSALSGVSCGKAVFFHKWLGRWVFIACTIHMGLSLKYWLGLDFKIMVEIPPQIFGFISYSCLGMLTFASFKFVRNYAFDFFLAQHRFFAFVMLLLAFMHNLSNRAPVLLGVHLLVLDRVVSKVMGMIHKYKSPTKGLSDFEILDSTTIRVSIPIKVTGVNSKRWWRYIVPRYGNWKAGQHIYLNVPKVSFFQSHPFTISSLQESGKMVIVLKVRQGFTKKLNERLIKMSEGEEELNSNLEQLAEVSCVSSLKSKTSKNPLNSDTYLVKNKEYGEEKSMNSFEPQFKEVFTLFPKRLILTMKTGILGPYGANYHPLTKFESVLFLSAGTGASFTLPVALELLKENWAKDQVGDYLYRPELTKITIVLSMRESKNLGWYDHLWEEFIPFMISGKLKIFVHITRQTQDATEFASVEPKFRKVPEEESIAFAQEEVSHSTQTSSIGSQEGFTMVYGRPKIDEYITKAVQDQICLKYRKAFACIGCGPHIFNGDIKSSCERNKWKAGAPLVYCYTESFG